MPKLQVIHSSQIHNKPTQAKQLLYAHPFCLQLTVCGLLLISIVLKHADATRKERDSGEHEEGCFCKDFLKNLYSKKVDPFAELLKLAESAEKKQVNTENNKRCNNLFSRDEMALAEKLFDQIFSQKADGMKFFTNTDNVNNFKKLLENNYEKLNPAVNFIILTVVQAKSEKYMHLALFALQYKAIDYLKEETKVPIQNGVSNFFRIIAHQTYNIISYWHTLQKLNKVYSKTDTINGPENLYNKELANGKDIIKHGTTDQVNTLAKQLVMGAYLHLMLSKPSLNTLKEELAKFPSAEDQLS